MVNIGLQIHETMTGATGWGTRAYSADEKNYLASTLKELNPSAILVLSNTDMALYYAAILPQTKVVLRFYHDREGDFYNITTPEHLFNAYSPWFKNPNIVINMGNESSSYVPAEEIIKQAAFYAKAMEIFGRAGIPLAVPGWGTGHPDYGALMLFEPIWAMFDKYPIHYLSLHEYFSYRGTEIGNGRVGRHEVIANWLVNHDHKIPNMFITEHGSDDIENDPYRGWQSWPNTPDREDRYFGFIQNCRIESYNLPYIKGVMLYSWGDSNGWWDFDISMAFKLHRNLIAANKINIDMRPMPVKAIPPPTVEVPIIVDTPVVVDRAPALIAELKTVLDKYK